tara:strand:- start:736 stop:876 length:141 start_codon:yes stop_codon:yes gene_type:complete
MNTDEFLRGQQDCKDGKLHTDKGKDYNRGYAAQYAMEQVLSHKGFN